MTEKEEIRERLNGLEENLKDLRQKFPKVFHDTNRRYNRPSNDTRIVTYFRKPQGNTYTLEKQLQEKNSIKSRGHFSNENPILACLQNISKNVAKGSEAMKKIASLTEISNISVVPARSVFHLASKDDREEFQFLSGSLNKWSDTSDICGKPSTQIKKKLKGCFSEGKGLTSNIREELIKEKQLRLNLENEISQLHSKLKTERLNVKKILKEEKSKREKIEKIADGYKMCIGKLKSDPRADIFKLDELTKELESEQLKGSQLEKHGSNLKTPSETSKQKLNVQLEEKIQVINKYSNIYQNDEFTKLLKKKNHDLSEKLEELQNYTEIKNIEFERLKNDLKCLKKYKEKEIEWEKQTEELKMKLRIYEQELDKKKHELEKRFSINNQVAEIDRYKKKYSDLEEDMLKMEYTLKTKCDDLQKEVINVSETSNERIYDLENKYSASQKELEKQKCNVTSLLKKIQELTNELKEEKNRVSECCDIRKQQEEFIKNLAAVINHRDSHLMLLTREGTLTLKTCDDMEKKIVTLSETIQQRDIKIEQLMKELESQRDIVLIKDKMLNDQLDTIKQLRKTAEENKKNIEEGKAEIKTLTKDLMHLEYYKEELLQQIAQMECEMERARGVMEREGKQQLILQNMETKIFEKQKEWDEKLCIIKEEKNEAIESTRYITQKLVGTIANLENQLQAAKNSQMNYNDVLKKKVYELEGAQNENKELKERLWDSERKRDKLVIKLRSALQPCQQSCKHQTNNISMRGVISEVQGYRGDFSYSTVPKTR